MTLRSDDIAADRVNLRLLRAADLARLLDGGESSVAADLGATFPSGWLEGAAGLVRFRLEQIGKDPASEPWLLRLIIRRDTGTVIGLINFHGPPDDRGFAEVGYGLEENERGQGYAVESVRALFDWAHAVHGVTRFRASIAPDNERSQNLVRKLGMTVVGSQWDERDGLEIIWAVEDWPDR